MADLFGTEARRKLAKRRQLSLSDLVQRPAPVPTQFFEGVPGQQDIPAGQIPGAARPFGLRDAAHTALTAAMFVPNPIVSGAALAGDVGLAFAEELAKAQQENMNEALQEGGPVIGPAPQELPQNPIVNAVDNAVFAAGGAQLGRVILPKLLKSKIPGARAAAKVARGLSALVRR